MGKIEKEETMGEVHCLHNGSWCILGGVGREARAKIQCLLLLGSRASKTSKSAVGGGGCGVFLTLQRKR